MGSTAVPHDVGSFPRVIRHYAEASAEARCARPLTIATVTGRHITGHIRRAEATCFDLEHAGGVVRLAYAEVAAIYDEHPRHRRG
jgi:hypothetical protein